MTAFPLASPVSYGVATLAWSARENTARARAPFTFQLITQAYDGRMWTGSLTLVPQKGADGRRLAAWLAMLRRPGTNAGMFMLGDPAAREPLGAAKDTPGTPLVDGGGQTGESLSVAGLPASTTGYLLEGDYIQIGAGVSARLNMVIEDVDSDAGGLATMKLWPGVRGAFADGTPITVSQPEAPFVAPGGVSTWQVRPPKIYEGITLEVAEVVT